MKKILLLFILACILGVIAAHAQQRVIRAATDEEVAARADVNAYLTPEDLEGILADGSGTNLGTLEAVWLRIDLDNSTNYLDDSLIITVNGTNLFDDPNASAVSFPAFTDLLFMAATNGTPLKGGDVLAFTVQDNFGASIIGRRWYADISYSSGIIFRFHGGTNLIESADPEDGSDTMPLGGFTIPDSMPVSVSGGVSEGGSADLSAIVRAEDNFVGGTNGYQFIASGKVGVVVLGGRSGSLSNSAAADWTTISGGVRNSILGDSTSSTIGGGAFNHIDAIFESVDSTISGGTGNAIVDAESATIGGGTGNTVTNAGNSTIAGGTGNRVHGPDYENQTSGTIGGGIANTVTNSESGIIPGGIGNVIRDAPLAVTLGHRLTNTTPGSVQIGYGINPVTVSSNGNFSAKGTISGNGSGMTNLLLSSAFSTNGIQTGLWTNVVHARIPIFVHGGTTNYLLLSTNAP
ncbi:MAG TPA: hypothetical protein VEH04_11365 [Verrucomicrobiae bacterium]|nr:hypothetical protein [Verrucomicrobiae bacterium]